ncbi:MAG: DUF3782 domain-containing protein [Candidatus Competibacteraceae bacterium]|jgi:hypothetical protein|nr:DUF3782 domain-containing protein [Candidatus Competibacteraceae bacterium]MCB1792867.1 DUF3782 domain-containing protein [Candidatus Competibacteraceae bacterium]HRW64209.1 DUF3782 domain-containing protein [Candidatus Competibacter sp.]
MTDLKTQLQTELPELLRHDSGFRQWLEQLIRQTAVTPKSFDTLLLEEIKRSRPCREQNVGAPGARWGITPKHDFCAVLKRILENNLGIKVLNVNEFDDGDTVFDTPD